MLDLQPHWWAVNLEHQHPISQVYLYVITHMLHVWNIYLHFPQKWPSFVGKYNSTMEHMGYKIPEIGFFSQGGAP